MARIDGTWQADVMGRSAIPSSFFVFTVVEHSGRFLVIRERKGAKAWYAPAGRLEPGETIVEAAVRETMEEAGVRVVPTSILRVDQQWFPEEGTGLSSWWRFVLAARPASAEITPKSWPDEHSLEARWLALDEIAALPLRHPEVIDLLQLRATEGLGLGAREFVRAAHRP
jgi:phosphatase NudJ